MKVLTHGSLFSGIGGFDLAAHWMGWENAFHCEINEFCSKVLKYHFPKSKHYADITKTDFREWRGKIDVLTGGFPCQPFSLAGKRKGADDNRYLWPEMLRAIQEIRPTWIIGENVAGIISMVQPGKEIEVEHQASIFEENDKEMSLDQFFVIETVCQDLESGGYSVQPVLIPACAVGAPHRRDRVWFIAHRSDTGIKSLQQKGKNRIYETESFADSNSNDDWGCRHAETGCQEEKSKSKQEKRQRIRRESERTCSEKFTPNSNKFNGNLSGFCTSGFSQFQTTGIREDNWQNFPTQSPVCSGNDGISSRLDGITFPKWGSESIKSFGNAIVPQVAFEILKIIHELSYE